MRGWKYYPEMKEEQLAIAFMDLVPIEFAVDGLAWLIVKGEKEGTKSPPNMLKDGVRYHEIIVLIKSAIESAVLAGNLQVYNVKDLNHKSKYLFKGKTEFIKITDLAHAVKHTFHNYIGFANIYVSLIFDVITGAKEGDLSLSDIDRMFTKYSKGSDFDGVPFSAFKKKKRKYEASQDDDTEDEEDTSNSPVDETDDSPPEDVEKGVQVRNTSLTEQEDSGSFSLADLIPSYETLHKIKNLPFNLMKQQVVMLAAEKEKWDTSIMVAVKIGLLYYEEGLSRAATEKMFITEYKQNTDKFPALPDTVLKKIYKHLPDGYRYSREGGKAAKENNQAIDLGPIIKAAVYAGSLVGSEDAETLSGLKKRLASDEIPLPADDIMKKIFKEVAAI